MGLLRLGRRAAVASGRFALVCVGGSLILTGLSLCLTGVGAVFGIPMMAAGWGLAEVNADRLIGIA